MRINASNWLRAAASETDIEIKAAGGSGTPTPMSAWSREMQHAAMANDRIAFMEAYRNALEAARKTVAGDPSVPMGRREQEAESRVLSSWRARDPLAIFATRPTPAQMTKLYSVMDPDGRQDVQQALARYESFTRLIRPTASPAVRQINRMTAPPRLNLTPASMGIGSMF
jgi:hypothetical protein